MGIHTIFLCIFNIFLSLSASNSAVGLKMSRSARTLTAASLYVEIEFFFQLNCIWIALKMWTNSARWASLQRFCYKNLIPTIVQRRKRHFEYLMKKKNSEYFAVSRQCFRFLKKELTLNLSASLSYEFTLLSTNALALQIAANVPRSSADSELFGLPGRTNACVPLVYRIKQNKNFGFTFTIFISTSKKLKWKNKTYLSPMHWEDFPPNWRSTEMPDHWYCPGQCCPEMY